MKLPCKKFLCPHKKTKPFFLMIVVIGIFITVEAWADVPHGASHVYVKGKQLIVQKRLEDGSLDKPKPYIIKGLTWSPATRAPDEGPNPFNPAQTVPYGFFFDWPNRYPQGYVVFIYWLRSQHSKHYLIDSSLMKEMNVNTVRLYNDFGDDPRLYKEILDEFYRNDIMVIMSVISSKDDIDKKRYKKIVQMCKDHPAILMWNLGNEWNLEYCKYWGYKTVAKAAKATNQVACDIKKIDSFHPVSSCLGDRFTDEKVTNTIEWIVDACPGVEVWGLNIYRGRNFGDLFTQWQKITTKPMYLSEFGIDSFETISYTRINEFQAVECKGRENQKLQAEYAISLWQDITKYLSAQNSDKPCLGGTLHSFNDSLWKVGSYHVNLGGLVNYYDPVEGLSYKRYNPEGFYLPGGTPDDIINEEYFGIVDADRNPKEVFWELKRYYKWLDELEN